MKPSKSVSSSVSGATVSDGDATRVECTGAILNKRDSLVTFFFTQFLLLVALVMVMVDIFWYLTLWVGSELPLPVMQIIHNGTWIKHGSGPKMAYNHFNNLQS
jgi:hypothetical protein